MAISFKPSVNNSLHSGFKAFICPAPKQTLKRTSKNGGQTEQKRKKPQQKLHKNLEAGTWRLKITFSNFSCMFLNPNTFSNMNSNCSNVLDMKNLQEQVKKAFCYQKLFWPFTVWIDCSSDLKIFANSGPSASNFKSFSRSLEQFFLTVGQNNFGNKIPFFCHYF